MSPVCLSVLARVLQWHGIGAGAWAYRLIFEALRGLPQLRMSYSSLEGATWWPLAPGRHEMWRFPHPSPHMWSWPCSTLTPCLPPSSAPNSSPWQGGRGPPDLPSLSISPASLRGGVFTDREGPRHRSDGPLRVPGFGRQLGSRSRFFPSFLWRNCSRMSM